MQFTEALFICPEKNHNFVLINRMKKIRLFFSSLFNGPYNKWIFNRYSVTIFAFLIWLTFFDRFDVISQIRLQSEVSGLRKQQSNLQSQIKKLQSDRNEVFGSNAALEKYARENYRMKKANEDVFVLTADSTK
jgi:cell division protein DivIC